MGNLTDGHINLIRTESDFFTRVFVKRSQDVSSILYALTVPIYAEQMATMRDTDAKTFLHLLEVSIMLATQVGQALVVLRVEKKSDRVGGCVQSGDDAPREAVLIITELNGFSAIDSPLSEFGRASVILRSMNSPICPWLSVKLTTRLFSVRPLS